MVSAVIIEWNGIILTIYIKLGQCQTVWTRLKGYAKYNIVAHYSVNWRYPRMIRTLEIEMEFHFRIDYQRSRGYILLVVIERTSDNTVVGWHITSLCNIILATNAIITLYEHL